jgi:hypothetical protein
MKRQITVGILLVVGLLIGGAGQPEQASSDKPCSLRTLKGTDGGILLVSILWTVSRSISPAPARIIITVRAR